jgi:hypothetical protein
MAMPGASGYVETNPFMLPEQSTDTTGKISNDKIIQQLKKLLSMIPNDIENSQIKDFTSALSSDFELDKLTRIASVISGCDSLNVPMLSVESIKEEGLKQ